MIPYEPEPFIDRSVQYPGRRYITRPDSTVELCQISRSHEGQNAEGAIYAEGTPLNAQSFNDEMTKIKDTLDSIGGDLSGKQDQLTAGSGIVIQNNVISATGGGGGSSTYLSGLADVGLYAPKSGDVLIFDSTQGKWINGDIVTGSGSGAIVSFNDGADGLPFIDLTTAITAVQSGTGDPSPSNVRPISGWTGLTVHVADGATPHVIDNTYPITWQTEAGTVYGGSLDVTSGVLTVTHAKITLDGTQTIRTTNWNPRTNTVGWLYSYSVTNNLLGTPRTSVPDIKCDSLTPTMYNSLSQSDVEGIGLYDTNYCGLVVRMADTSLNTESAINAYLSEHPIDVVFPLAQPVTVQLTPTEVETLLGTNNIWSDAGNITSLKYYRQQAQEIISLIQFDTSIKQWAEERFAPLYTDVTGTLTAGQTYLILNSPKILTTSTIDIYTDTFGVAPYAIEVQNGNIRLTFVARASDLNVKVRIS